MCAAVCFCRLLRVAYYKIQNRVTDLPIDIEGLQDSVGCLLMDDEEC